MDSTSERLALIALALTHGIGRQLLGRLLDTFGSPSAVLNVPPITLQTVRGIGKQIAAEICAIDQDRLDQITRDLKRWQNAGIDLILWGDSEYPQALIDLPDAPLTLFTRGGMLDPRPARDCRRIALVGTRQPTAESHALTVELARGFALRGWIVVSGLARGIDTAAHRAALASGGRTIAVLGSGISPTSVYPPENADLAQSISGRGLLICECAPESLPSAKYLTLRNRLISGLSQVVVVIEAGSTSGALYAARHARSQGRLLCAVPNGSEGNQALIAAGALPVREAEDILRGLA